VVWVQEEPKNMGAWRYMRERMFPLLEPGGRRITYAGRPESASPAAGSHKRHVAEQAAVIEDALSPATPRSGATRTATARKTRQAGTTPSDKLFEP
jgi:2-oxoglutarate dehydrogenase E1 component